jgi:hypothetical protein
MKVIHTYYSTVLSLLTKKKLGVKVKFKHEIDIYSAIGMILQIYKCSGNSGRENSSS